MSPTGIRIRLYCCTMFCLKGEAPSPQADMGKPVPGERKVEMDPHLTHLLPIYRCKPPNLNKPGLRHRSLGVPLPAGQGVKHASQLLCGPSRGVRGTGAAKAQEVQDLRGAKPMSKRRLGAVQDGEAVCLSSCSAAALSEVMAMRHPSCRLVFRNRLNN